MKNEDVTSSESEIRRASKRGAVEDVIHVTSDENGHDLRVSNRFGANLKQELNDSENM